MDLTTSHRGLRFVSSETECAYRKWHRDRAVLFTRAGLVASVLAWTFSGTVMNLGVDVPTVPHFAAMIAFLSLCLWLTFPRPQWAPALAMVTNVAAGLGVVGLAFGPYDRPDAVAVVIVCSFFGFVVFQLHPEHAAPTVLGYILVLQVALVLSHSSEELTTVDLIAYSTYAWNAFLCGVVICLVLESQLRKTFRDEQTIETLLLNILPGPIAEKLKGGPAVIAERFDEVTILFADVVGFTPLAASMEPERVVAMLNDVFTTFDELADLHGVEKIKTIGDAYMAVGGLPTPRPDHADAVADLALAMRDVIADLASSTGHSIDFRIGLCSGPAVAGVIGLHKFAYDLWGDTVNVAARMESHGVPGSIQVAPSSRALLGDRYDLVERGEVELKGKGTVTTWFLLGKRAETPAPLGV